MGDLFLDTGVLNKVCDDAYRSCCCKCLAMCGRPTFPTDPWFKATVLDDYKVAMEGRDVKYVQDAIQQAGGRVKPWRPWLCCTRDFICCGLVPAIDEARFGYLVIRKAAVEPTGRATLEVWPDHVDLVKSAMTNLTDKFNRPIPVQVIQRAALADDDNGVELSVRAAAQAIGDASSEEQVPVASQVS